MLKEGLKTICCVMPAGITPFQGNIAINRSIGTSIVGALHATPLPGVHEHWNNPMDKQYSRNLGSGEGIELVKTFHNRQS